MNQQLVDNSAQWVTDFTTNHPGFKNWENEELLSVSAQTSQAVQTACADKKTCAQTGACEACDGCAIAISRIYKSYEVYLNNLFAETFKVHSEKMFDKLHQANLALEAPQ